MEHLQRYEEEQISQLRYWSPAPARADLAHPDSLAADVDDLLEVAAAIRQVDSDKSLTSQVSDTGSQRLTQQHQPKHVGHVAVATASEAARSGMDEERNTGSSERGGAVGQGNWGEGVVVHAGKSMGGAVGAAAATAAATEAAAALIRPRGLYAAGQSGRSLGGGRRQARRGVKDKLGEAATTGAHTAATSAWESCSDGSVGALESAHEALVTSRRGERQWRGNSMSSVREEMGMGVWSASEGVRVETGRGSVLGRGHGVAAHEVEGRWGSEGGYVTRREMHAVLAGMAQLQHTVDGVLLHLQQQQQQQQQQTGQTQQQQFSGAAAGRSRDPSDEQQSPQGRSWSGEQGREGKEAPLLLPLPAVLLLSALVALVHALWSTCKWGVGLVWPLCLLLPLMHRMEHHCRLHCQIWTGAGDGMDRE
ncbi:unnamed protein product [Closterium sp. NIES-65]|nr:unnamed protein product [Closterium sp. NIES-65]